MLYVSKSQHCQTEQVAVFCTTGSEQLTLEGTPGRPKVAWELVGFLTTQSGLCWGNSAAGEV